MWPPRERHMDTQADVEVNSAVTPVMTSTPTKVSDAANNGEPVHDGDGECTHWVDNVIVLTLVCVLALEIGGDGRDWR